MSDLLPIEGETTPSHDHIHFELLGADPELEAARLAQMEAADKLAAEVEPTIEAGKKAEQELEDLKADAPTEADLNPLEAIRNNTTGLIN